MKSIPLALTLVGLLFLGGCKSTAAPHAATAVCTCGTHAGAIDGCHDPRCMDGTGNPDNPDCHCAPIKVSTGKASTDKKGDS